MKILGENSMGSQPGVMGKRKMERGKWKEERGKGREVRGEGREEAIHKALKGKALQGISLRREEIGDRR